ncbi:MAG: alpha/beta hydrolase, partial [Myxococcales bacterium]|nr:alpha/beta hydrolase [Myxococcales bacterium]
DLPTAVDAVLARANAQSLDYIGFSMGGMLLYAALGRSVSPERVRKAVIMGSPAKIGLPIWPFSKTPWVPHWFIPRLHLRLGARLIAFGSEWFKTPFHRIPYNPDNVDRGVVGGILVDGVQDVPRGLNQDFVRWATGDNELRVDDERCLDGLAKVRVPALFLAGQRDVLAPPRSVRHAFDAWGKDAPAETVDKRWVLLSRDEGAGHDYGHGDMLMARSAVRDVFEPIADFVGAGEV